MFISTPILIIGGYVDDDDAGDEIWYTGQGGQGPDGRQVSDQTYTRGNLGLKLCCDKGKLFFYFCECM
jgi:hypothetical protein